MRNKICANCGMPFQAKRSDSKYCSQKCGKQAYYLANRKVLLEKNLQWTKANPAKVTAIKKRYEEKHSGKERYEKLKSDPLRLAATKERQRQHYLANRDEYLERARAQRQSNPRGHYNSRHGCDWGKLIMRLWWEQDGKCYLCGDHLEINHDDLSKALRKVHLDHDHNCCPLGYSCEKCRRGLACADCNILIGRAKDDPVRLRRIADNLEKVLRLHSEP